MTRRSDALILTCEHGGNAVPARWRRLFVSRAARRALASHRGWDIGALALARRVARRLDAPLIHATTTRLLVDLNRSLHHRSLFSEFTRGLSPDEKRLIVEEHWLPHRRRVEEAISIQAAMGRRIVHVGVHTFTPALGGVTRRADVGLLYDPLRAGEKALCSAWLEELKRSAPALRCRRNYPYLGTSDGLVTALRSRFDARRYIGVELEVNQRWFIGDRRDAARIEVVIAGSLMRALR